MPRITRWMTLLLVAALAVALSGCSSEQDAAETGGTTAAEQTAGPALWRIADEDTTIHLFGTFHLLPESVEWFDGPIAAALGDSDALVTELGTDAATQAKAIQVLDGASKLPPGERLRDLLNGEQRALYESAMSKIGAPVAAFDDREPWFAGVALSALLAQGQGFDPSSGAEAVLEREAGAQMQREALETPEFQTKLFDSLPQQAQIRLLVETVRTADDFEPLLDRMLTAWVEGDEQEIADLLNESVTESGLMDALLYRRNRAWAEWIDKRMDTPGTVFVAVGAGHLAGDQSVQDVLAERDITTTRIQ